MKAAVVVFPGSNRDRDMMRAIEIVTGHAPVAVWHGDTDLPPVDLVTLPGGFTYGDYLRAGAIAARAPIMTAVAERAAAGVPVLGVCNGFQILCEAGLLPGILMRNADLHFICKPVRLKVETADSVFTNAFAAGDVIDCPVAHGEGNYRCGEATLRELVGEDRIAFRYVDDLNGSVDRIAGILNDRRNVLGMMPHPENLVEPIHGGLSGRGVFESLVDAALEVTA